MFELAISALKGFRLVEFFSKDLKV